METEIREWGLLCLGRLLKDDKDLIRIAAAVFRESSTESEYLQNVLLASGDVLSENLFPSRFDFYHSTWDEEKRREERRCDRDLFKTLKGEESSAKATRCKKCQELTNVSYVVAQTRRGDEGMTTFLSCSRCGSRWVSST